MYDFEFLRPATLDEAIAALADDDAIPLAGGQTLLPTMKARLAAPERLVSLAGIPDLVGIRQEGNNVTIGSMTTHAQASKELRPIFPGLAALVSGIGDPAVQNRGTIGGSLANNDPSACYPPAALGTGATIVTNSREVGADDFFDGLFTTALDDGEIITSVRFPIAQAAHYEKFHQPASRFPLVASFVVRFDDAIRVAITGAGADGVFRWTAAEEVLAAEFSAAAVEVLDPPSEDMIEDIHGAADYRRHLCRVMTARAVRHLA